MTVNDLDDDLELAPVPEGEQLEQDNVRPNEDGHVRRAAIGITAAIFNGMVLVPRSEANALLRTIGAETLPFGGFFGYYEGKDVEIHHLDIVTPVCERYWPDVADFLYGPANVLEPALKSVGIELAPLPADFMDPFERGLARYAIYGNSQ